MNDGVSMLNRPKLYVDTLRHLRPTQLLQSLLPRRIVRLDNQAQETAIRSDVALLMPELDLEPSYCQRFNLPLLKRGYFQAIGEIHPMCYGEQVGSNATPLWSFNQHYFEYAIALGAAHAKSDAPNMEYWLLFKRLVNEWISASQYPKGDGWHPYTISLRLINWQISRELFADQLVLDPEFDTRMRASMYLQYRHLLVNQEKRLLANHYFENLKTLVVFSQLFSEDAVFHQVWQSFEYELDEQILKDGVHVERSLMYQKLVYEGMLRVSGVLHQTTGTIPPVLRSKIRSVLDAMASLERGMGKTPFFNDAADGVAKECDALVRATKSQMDLVPELKSAFPEAGYFKLYDGDVAVLVDAGLPGPNYMLGHAHCDVLSYELSLRGEPLIVNSGVYAYQSKLRPWFRSTEAHNTAMVAGHEQMQCWSAHRVGARIRSLRVLTSNDHCIVAEFESCHGEVHRRTIQLRDGLLTVTDSFRPVRRSRGRFSRDAYSYVHCAPGLRASVEGGGVSSIYSSEGRYLKLTDDCSALSSDTDPAERDDSLAASVTVIDGSYSPEFGCLKSNTVIQFRFNPRVASHRYCLSFIIKGA